MTTTLTTKTTTIDNLTKRATFKPYDDFNKKVNEFKLLYNMPSIIAVPLTEIEKKPLFSGWTKDDAATIDANIKSVANSIDLNKIGFITGEKAGLFVIDFDDKDDDNFVNGMNWWLENLEAYDDKEQDQIANIFTVATPSGGIHMYFKYDERLNIFSNKANAFEYNCKKLTIDIRTDKGFIVAPNSKYPSKKDNQIKNYDILYGKIDYMPEFLFKLFKRYYPAEPKHGETKINKNQLIQKTVITNNDDTTMIDDEKAEELLSLLSDKRFASYDDWVKIAIASVNSGINYKVFDKVCEKFSGYNAENNLKIWNSIVAKKNDELHKRLTIKSLYYWACLDNPDKYFDFREKYFNDVDILEGETHKKLFESIKGETDNDLAEMVYYFLKNDYKFCKGEWFNFDKITGRWYKSGFKTSCALKSAVSSHVLNEVKLYDLSLRHSITFNDLPPKFKTMHRKDLLYLLLKNEELSDQGGLSEYYGDGRRIKNKFKQDCNISELMKIIENEKNNERYSLFPEKDKNQLCVKQVLKELGDAFDVLDCSKAIKLINLVSCWKKRLTSNASLVNICAIKVAKYEDRDFSDKLDDARHLIAFNNGVYDFNNKKFRPLEYADFMTSSTNFNYNQEVSESARIKWMDTFNTIEINQEKRDYLISSLAACFFGKNQFQVCNIWLGKGANGKSFLAECVKEMLGDYAGTLKASYFTAKESAPENHTEGLNKIMKKRFVYASEPDRGQDLNIEFFKHIVGGDTVNTRGHQGKQNAIVPFFNLFLLCNSFPNIKADANDYSLKRRLRATSFDTSFVDNPNENNPNEKLLNPNLKTELSDEAHKNALFNILLEYYLTLDPKKEPKLPDAITKQSNTILADPDFLIDGYIKRRLEYTGDLKEYVALMTFLMILN